MMISRMIPPPTAVVIARIFTPKISIFYWMPAIAPDNAKAMVPIMSKIFNRLSDKNVLDNSSIKHLP